MGAQRLKTSQKFVMSKEPNVATEWLHVAAGCSLSPLRGEGVAKATRRVKLPISMLEDCMKQGPMKDQA